MQNLNCEKCGIGIEIDFFYDSESKFRTSLISTIIPLKIGLKITRIISDIGDWCEDGLSSRRRQEVLARRAVLVAAVSCKGQEVSLHLDAGSS